MTDKLTDKLTPEQRDWIMNRAREHTYKVRKIADKRAEYDAINVIRLDTILTANTEPEEEIKCPECGGKVNEHKALCPIGVNSNTEPEDKPCKDCGYGFEECICDIDFEARNKCDETQNHLDASCIDVAIKHINRLQQENL